MTAALIFLALAAHLIVPIWLLAWVYRSKAKSKTQWLVAVFVTLSYLLMMWLGGAGWYWFGSFWPVLFLFLLVAQLPLGWKKRQHLPWRPQSRRAWIVSSFQVFLGTTFALAIPSTLSARSFDRADALELRFPLKGGEFQVIHGGSNGAMNHHYTVLAQRYALDIVQVGSWGLRASGILPSDLSAYKSFGARVVAPCSGEVIAAESHLPDQTPPSAKPEQLLGNHLVLACGSNSVLLAHLKQESLMVKVGEKVSEGDLIAQVGNTGNTSEPHLHIHAVKGIHRDVAKLAAEAQGLPMVFDGRFLARHDRVLAP